MSKGNIRLSDKLTSGGEVIKALHEVFDLPLTEKLEQEEESEKLNDLKETWKWDQIGQYTNKV